MRIIVTLSGFSTISMNFDDPEEANEKYVDLIEELFHKKKATNQRKHDEEEKRRIAFYKCSCGAVQYAFISAAEMIHTCSKCRLTNSLVGTRPYSYVCCGGEIRVLVKGGDFNIPCRDCKKPFYVEAIPE